MERIQNILNLLKTKWYYTAGGGFFVLLVVWALIPAAEPVEIALVKRGRYEQIVKEEGITRVREKFALLSPVSGVLQRVTVHAGDPVEKNQILAYVKWDDARPVRSPVAGRVLGVTRESEGPIQQGELIMEVGDTSSLEIVIDALTGDAVQVKPEAAVLVERWGGVSPLEAKVRRVEPSAFTKVSALGVEEQRVRILADITSAPELWNTLGDRYRVECSIVVHRAENAIIAPAGALFRQEREWAVFKVESGRARLRVVKVAMRGPASALITEGLGDQDEVIVYPGDRIRDGIRVRSL